MKFTFKTVKPTGKWRTFHSNEHQIKINRKQVGTISDDAPYKIRFAIKKEVTKEDPAPFKWVTLKRENESIDAAKTFLNEKFESLTTQFDLHYFE